tara:strand:- start:81 stop:380 length:300 start_codon:yes stop_codon:yes gene_type:complete
VSLLVAWTTVVCGNLWWIWYVLLVVVAGAVLVLLLMLLVVVVVVVVLAVPVTVSFVSSWAVALLLFFAVLVRFALSVEELDFCSSPSFFVGPMSTNSCW